MLALAQREKMSSPPEQSSQQLVVSAQAELLLLFICPNMRLVPGSQEFRSSARNKSREVRDIRAMYGGATLLMALVVIMLSLEFESWLWHSFWVIPFFSVASMLLYFYWRRRCRAGEAIMRKEFEEWAYQVRTQLMIIYKINKEDKSLKLGEGFLRLLKNHQDLIRNIFNENHGFLNWLNGLIQREQDNK